MLDQDSPLLFGLPDDVARVIAAAPVTNKKLLELGLTWAGLGPAHARAAEWLRVFLITWDPLEHVAVPRPTGFATVNTDPAGGELPVYLPLWALTEQAVGHDVTLASVIGNLASSAVTTLAMNQLLAAADHAPHRARAAQPDLLADPTAGAALGTPQIHLVSPTWQDIGLGAITDIVQHAFGPVDLDRSPVELAPAPRPDAGCPACRGRRFGFPADLAEARDRMCRPHRTEAEKVIRSRLARANASNPDGWAAITDASTRLGLPHLPNGLATKLAPARHGVYVIDQPEELAERASLVVQAAAWFPGRVRDFTVALGEQPDWAGMMPDWLVTLILDLGRAGLGAQAEKVGDALAEVDPDQRAFYHADIPVALAQAGMADQARARVAANLARWPDDVWVRIHAGDAYATLSDPATASTHFQTALDLADQLDDTEARRTALHRLRQTRRDSGESPPTPTRPRHQPKRSTSRRKRKQ